MSDNVLWLLLDLPPALAALFQNIGAQLPGLFEGLHVTASGTPSGQARRAAWFSGRLSGQGDEAPANSGQIARRSAAELISIH